MAAIAAETPLDLVIQGLNWILEGGWDREFGGLYYYLDALGHPPEKLEWDMKLWWVHAESALAALRGYKLSGDDRLLKWYESIDDYMWQKFRHEDNEEWFGYLSRQGGVTHQIAGGKWKGFFHLPRALEKMVTILEFLDKNQKKRSM